jgi:hypothetical protein
LAFTRVHILVSREEGEQRLETQYTGLLRDGRMVTLWYVAADAALTARKEVEPATIRKLNWWRA